MNPFQSSALALLCIACTASTATLAEPLRVDMQPKALILEPDARAQLRVRAPGQSDRVRGATSSGMLEGPQILSADEVLFTYAPGTARHPRVAKLLFWLHSFDGPPDITVASLPLIGRMDLEVKTEPDARVSVEVANKTFGPQTANPRGLAVVPIEVPPGITTARALADSAGQSTAVEVALPTPPPAGLSGSLLPQPLTTGASGWLWLVHPPKLDPASIEIQAQGASVVPLRRADDRTLFEVRPQPGAQRVEIEASLKNTPASRVQFASDVNPAPPPTAPVALPPSGPPSPLYPALFGAGLVGSGPVAGMQLALQLGYRLPTSALESAVELEVGLRAMGLKPGVFVGGTPLLLAFRARALSTPKWTIDGKVGAGLFAFFHRARQPGEEAAFESGFASDIHLAGQLAMKQEGAEIFIELRGFALPLRSRLLSEDLFGVMVGIGIR